MAAPTILIVDDSRAARALARKTIRTLRPEWAFEEAGSADEALVRLGGAEIDAVLLDVNMPGVDGFELATQLSDRAPDLPIAILTGNVQVRVQRRAEERGYLFINKPVLPPAMLAFIELVEKGR